MKKVVILNAPPAAGKDTVADYFEQQYPYVTHLRFKQALFDLSIAVAQISEGEFFGLYNNRELKETPSDLLFGRSPREHMIHTSEELVKPVYGKEYFGDVLAKTIATSAPYYQYDTELFVVSDGGFIEELQPVIREVGRENVLILRIHRDGCDFSNDSRDYMAGTGCVEVDLINNGTLEELYENADTMVDLFMDGFVKAPVGEK